MRYDVYRMNSYEFINIKHSNMQRMLLWSVGHYLKQPIYFVIWRAAHTVYYNANY